MVKGLAHICFVVRDLEASEAFYCDKLGFERAFDFVNEHGRRFGVYLKIGGRNFIELFEEKGAKAQGQTERQSAAGGYHHFCLEVDDIAAVVGELVGRGVEVSEVKKEEADGSYQAWLSDNEGNKIELHQYTPESKQAQWVS